MGRGGIWALGLMAVIAVVGCRSPATGKTEAIRTESLVDVDGPGVLQLVKETEAPAAVVINFWATWCGPCKEEFPMLVQMGKQYGGRAENGAQLDRGVRLHFVSMDFPEERSSALTFLIEQDAELPSYVRVGKDHAFITAVHPSWSGALPATLVYGPEKRLRYFWEGKVDEAVLTEALDTLVDEASR